MLVAKTFAVIVVVPVVVPAVAIPFDSVTLLITAILVLDEAQETNSVRFDGPVVPAEYVPVAVNCVDVPALMNASALNGFISIEVRSTMVAVTLAVISGWALSIAVITTVPVVAVPAVTSPAPLTVATAVSDDCHVTWVHEDKVIPSEK